VLPKEKQARRKKESQKEVFANGRKHERREEGHDPPERAGGKNQDLREKTEIA